MPSIMQIPNTCNGGPNAQCVYSLRTYDYRCCHDVWDATDLPLFDTTQANEGYAKPCKSYYIFSLLKLQRKNVL